MTNQQLAVLLKGYSSQLDEALETVKTNLVGDVRVSKPNPFYIPGVNDKTYITFPVLEPIEEVLRRLENSINILLTGDDT